MRYIKANIDQFKMLNIQPPRTSTKAHRLARCLGYTYNILSKGHLTATNMPSLKSFKEASSFCWSKDCDISFGTSSIQAQGWRNSLHICGKQCPRKIKSQGPTRNLLIE